LDAARRRGLIRALDFFLWGIMRDKNKVSIEQGTWYYFTVDLSFKGFLPFRFLRYIDVNSDRMGALVELTESSHFSAKQLILLPYTREPDYFRVEPSGILSVWTFDGSNLGDAKTIDLESKWPHNILDKAAIAPSIKTADEWTKNK
jgi:hypothetical protein